MENVETTLIGYVPTPELTRHLAVLWSVQCCLICDSYWFDSFAKSSQIYSFRIQIPKFNFEFSYMDWFLTENAEYSILFTFWQSLVKYCIVGVVGSWPCDQSASFVHSVHFVGKVYERISGSVICYDVSEKYSI